MMRRREENLSGGAALHGTCEARPAGAEFWKRLRRLVLPAAAAACLAPGLAGCHGGSSLQAFDVPESLSEDEIELTFWAKNDTNKTQTQIYADAIEGFESYYPNIHVTLRLYTNYNDIYNDVITNISTGTTPNVCITYPDHIETYRTGSNVVVPLDELMADERFGLGGSEVRFDAPAQGEVIGKYLEECRTDGRLWAMPYMRSTEACYINKTYVEKLGCEVPDILTWDFIWEVSEKAMEKADDGTFAVNGQNVLIPFIYKSTDNMMIQMLRQMGAGYSTEDGEIQLFSDTTKEILLQIASHAQDRSFSTFKVSGYPANFLNAGQCIFAVDSTAGATWMGTDAPLLDISADKVVEFETAVRMVPQYDPENPQMISQGPSVCIFNRDDADEVLASWLFVQYLLTDEVQTAYAQTEGYVPVTSRAQTCEAYTDYLSRRGEDNSLHYEVKMAASQLLLDYVDNTFVTPVFNGSASLRDAAGQLIESTVKSARRRQTVDDAYIAQLYEDVTSLYRLDQTGSSSGVNEDLGPLPLTARVLLISLAAAWVLMGVYVLTTRRRR